LDLRGGSHVARDRHLADWKVKGTAKMRDRDLIKDRWIKRTRGERSSSHADWKVKGTTKMRDRDLIVVHWIKRTRGERSSSR
jgi:hypothetical protein